MYRGPFIRWHVGGCNVPKSRGEALTGPWRIRPWFDPRRRDPSILYLRNRESLDVGRGNRVFIREKRSVVDWGWMLATTAKCIGRMNMCGHEYSKAT